MQKTYCPKCNCQLKCNEEQVGKKVKCRNCAHVFVLASDSYRTEKPPTIPVRPEVLIMPEVGNAEIRRQFAVVPAQPRAAQELPDHLELNQGPIQPANSDSTIQRFEQMELPKQASGDREADRWGSLERTASKAPPEGKRPSSEIARREDLYALACRLLGVLMLVSLIGVIFVIVIDVEKKRQIVREFKFLKLVWNEVNLAIVIVVLCIWGTMSVVTVTIKSRLVIWAVLALATFRLVGISTLVHSCGIKINLGLGVELIVFGLTAILATWCIYLMYCVSVARVGGNLGSIQCESS